MCAVIDNKTVIIKEQENTGINGLNEKFAENSDLHYRAISRVMLYLVGTLGLEDVSGHSLDTH